MQAISPLKLLTPELAVSLRTFNEATRTLQRLGVRLHRIDPTANRLTISPEDGHHLQRRGLLVGFQRHPSAGSTRYVAQFNGVELTWSEPISYRDYNRPTSLNDTTFF